MVRRLLLCLALSLIVAAPAAGEDIHRRKQGVDERLSSLHTKIAHARSQEAVLTQEIGVVDARITGLQDDVARAQATLSTLEAQLAASQRKLDRVTALVKVETSRLVQLRRDYGLALGRLQVRLIDAYETPDVNAIDVILAAKTVSSMLNDIEYFAQVGKQDKHVSDTLFTAKTEMFAARERTRKLEAEVTAETAAIRTRTDQQQSVTAQLISSKQQLSTALDSKRSTLSSIKVDESAFTEEARQLAAVSASLESKIRAAEAAAAAAAARRAAQPKPTPSSGGSPGGSESSGAPPVSSSSGLIWPVSGPITSPYGPRCLPNGDCSFHPGIDIGAASGTPIRAAAAGTVIYSGWLGGYGNLVVIDHGNELATAYGHQSSIAVGVGTSVAQGQVIGYVGCTGYCFGPHLHFEVRVNGLAVDPLGYL